MKNTQNLQKNLWKMKVFKQYICSLTCFNKLLENIGPMTKMQQNVFAFTDNVSMSGNNLQTGSQNIVTKLRSLKVSPRFLFISLWSNKKYQFQLSQHTLTFCWWPLNFFLTIQICKISEFMYITDLDPFWQLSATG